MQKALWLSLLFGFSLTTAQLDEAFAQAKAPAKRAPLEEQTMGAKPKPPGPKRPVKAAKAAESSQNDLEMQDEPAPPTSRKSAKRKTPVSQEELIEEEEGEAANLSEQLATIENKINVTKREINKVRDASYLPDLYFSLADMYVQKSRVMYLLKVEKNKGINENEIDFTAEKRPKQEAIEIYQKIYSFFPKEKRRDKALFLKGLEQRDLGQFEQMIRTFNDLSQEFPQSENFNEANIILGDYLFEQKKDVEAALEVFRKVVSRPLSAFTPLAHYRMGWCYMNQTKYPDTVREFEEAINKQNQTNPDELPEIYRKTDIRREAVLALAVPYVEMYIDPNLNKGELPPPVDYFLKKSPDHFTYRRVLTRAGRRLILKEKWKESADSFFHVLVLSTDFDTRFEALQRVNESHKRKESRVDFLPFIREIGITVDLLQASLDRPLVLNAQALIELDKERKNQKAKGAKDSGIPKKPLNQLAFLEILMRDFATQLHSRARTTGSSSDFDQTAEGYEIYLSRFPQAPKALDIKYNMAETQFKGDRLVKAGMQYELLSKDPRLKKRASTFQESAVESFTKALQKADTLNPLERIRARRGLREVGGLWIKNNPKAPGVPTAAFNIANSWYEERNLKKAIETFKAFIKQYPQDARVRDAIFTIINSYSQLDDYKGLQVAGEQLGKTAGLSEADRNTIRDAVRRAQTKQIQAMAGDFGTKEYAENLLSVASKYKGSALGSQALYEAFSSLRSKRDPELFEVGEAMLDQHSDSQYAKEVASSMATLALSTASFDRAAKYLSRFSDKYPQEKEATEFRKTSAVLFERQGDFKKAKTQYAKLGDRQALARMDLATNDWASLERSSAAAGSEGKYWRALAVWRQRRYQDAAPLLRALASDPSIPPDQSGHAKYLMAQLSLERFRSIRMKSAEDQASLMEKVKAFQALSAELQNLVKTSAGRWPIAALYLLGQTHYDLGRFIADSPLPAGLSAADKKVYIGELTKQAGTYLAEADKVFATCIDAAEKNDVFTRYVEGCRAKGRKLIREEDDMAKIQTKAAGSEPPRAKAIRKELFEKSKDTALLFDLAETYIRADQPQTASGIFSRILEIEFNSARAVASVGVSALYLNEYDVAYDQFKRALDMDPQDATALWNLAALYKHFGFNNKFNSIRARMKGVRPPKLQHPWTKQF